MRGERSDGGSAARDRVASREQRWAHFAIWLQEKAEKRRASDWIKEIGSAGMKLKVS